VQTLRILGAIFPLSGDHVEVLDFKLMDIFFINFFLETTPGKCKWRRERIGLHWNESWAQKM
jgi:hypothetical protein